MTDANSVETTVTSTATGTESTRTQLTATRNGRLVGAAFAGATLWSGLRKRALWASKWLRNVVSPVGWCAVIVVVCALVLGLLLHWVELVSAGIAALVLLLIATVFLLGRDAYDVSTSLQDLRVVVGDNTTGTVTVKNKLRRFVLPGRVDIPVSSGVIEVRVPMLKPGAKHVAEVALPTQKRAVMDVGPVKTVRADPIGLLRAENSWSEKFKLYVHPVTTLFSTAMLGFLRDLDGTPSTAVVDQDISFHAIREYQPGDSPRHIHWRSTAKTGTLMVRQYEETRRSRIALFLGASPSEFATDDEYELAISALGSLGVSALRDHRELSVLSSAYIPEIIAGQVVRVDTSTPMIPRALLDDLSSRALSAGAARLGQVAELAAQSLDDISIAFIFVGSEPSISELRRMALKLPFGTEVVVVRAQPLERPGVKTLGETTILTIAVPDDFRHLMMRGER